LKSLKKWGFQEFSFSELEVETDNEEAHSEVLFWNESRGYVRGNFSKFSDFFLDKKGGVLYGLLL
jgi:hypothetical protein